MKRLRISLARFAERHCSSELSNLGWRYEGAWEPPHLPTTPEELAAIPTLDEWLAEQESQS